MTSVPAKPEPSSLTLRSARIFKFSLVIVFVQLILVTCG